MLLYRMIVPMPLQTRWILPAHSFLMDLSALSNLSVQCFLCPLCFQRSLSHHLYCLLQLDQLHPFRLYIQLLSVPSLRWAQELNTLQVGGYIRQEYEDCSYSCFLAIKRYYVCGSCGSCYGYSHLRIPYCCTSRETHRENSEYAVYALSYRTVSLKPYVVRYWYGCSRRLNATCCEYKL